MGMGKAATFTTPLYLSVAWSFMITYQLFTETAVRSVMNEVITYWPVLGEILVSRLDLIVFITAFSWLFVLSSVIPSLLLGKGSRVFTQFIIVLMLTFSTLFIQDIVTILDIEVEQIFSLVELLSNPLDAVSYLVLPCLLMLFADVFSSQGSN